MAHRDYYNTIEQYSGNSGWSGPKIRFSRYPVSPQRLCCGAGDNQNAFAHIPRAINPASTYADQAKGCGSCGFFNKEPLIGCFNPNNVCKKNGVPYDSKANLIIPPYSMPYETRYDCQRPVCKRGELTCTSQHRGAMYTGAHI